MWCADMKAVSVVCSDMKAVWCAVPRRLCGVL